MKKLPDPKEGLPNDAVHFTFETRQGYTLHAYRMDPKNRPRACILLIHGVQCHARLEWMSEAVDDPSTNQTKIEVPSRGSWFVRLCEDLDAVVVAYDQQGHGHSDGWKGQKVNVEVFEDYVGDALELLNHIQSQVKAKYDVSLPQFVFGISMGGAVTARLAEIDGMDAQRDTKVCAEVLNRLPADKRDKFDVRSICHVPKDSYRLDGVVCFAPMLSLDALKAKPINKILLPFTNVAAKIVPGARLAAIRENDKFPFIEEYKSKDVLAQTGAIAVRLAQQNLKVVDSIAQDSAMTGRKNPNFSMLLIHSVADDMCEPEGSKRHLEKVSHIKNRYLWLLDPKASKEDLEFSGEQRRSLPLDMWHYLLMEPPTKHLMVNVLAHVKSRVSDLTGEEDPANKTKEDEKALQTLDTDVTTADSPSNEPSSKI